MSVLARWNLDKTRIRGVENHDGGVADLKHRDQFPSTVLSWPQHGNGIFIRRTSPVIPGNAIFILQGKTRMLRPRMLMVSKDRNENEGRIKLCSNHREFRPWRLVSLRRGHALVSWKKIVYRRAYMKLTLKLSVTSYSSIEKNFTREYLVQSHFTTVKNLIS